MPKIVHYREKCIGCAVCFEMQPDVWRMSQKDGKATLVGAIKKKDVHILAVNYESAEEVFRAATACPVKIIKLMQ